MRPGRTFFLGGTVELSSAVESAWLCASPAPSWGGGTHSLPVPVGSAVRTIPTAAVRLSSGRPPWRPRRRVHLGAPASPSRCRAGRISPRQGRRLVATGGVRRRRTQPVANERNDHPTLTFTVIAPRSRCGARPSRSCYGVPYPARSFGRTPARAIGRRLPVGERGVPRKRGITKRSHPQVPVQLLAPSHFRL